ncbi:hypothetical protein AB205_0053770, partial [Aquarana catesbeiana]
MLCFETCLFMYQKNIFKVKLYKTKMLFFYQKMFYNAHVNVHGVKGFILNNVWLLLSMLNATFRIKLVFTVTM